MTDPTLAMTADDLAFVALLDAQLAGTASCQCGCARPALMRPIDDVQRPR